MLRDLQLKQAYHKPEDDIAQAFYLPALAEANRYDRAVGYFSSAVYSLAWPSLRRFVDGGGRMRLICSPMLSSGDADALFAGYSVRSEEEQAVLLMQEFRRLLSTPGSVKPTKVLAALVALEVVDFRIAWVTADAGGRSQRLFHDKVGIFSDTSGDAVVFRGSMNETWSGLSLDGNLESVDVFLSWEGDREQDRVIEETEYFGRLWNGTFPGVEIRPLPEIAREELISASDVDQWEGLVGEICVEIDEAERRASKLQNDPRKPRLHQVAALAAWEKQNRRGILKHATGSGKTFTALCAIGEALELGETPLVLVPSELLLKQWEDELRTMFEPQGAKLLVCGGGNGSWRQGSLLRQWTRSSLGQSRIVLATVQTASSGTFLELCSAGDHLFLVADEVHRVGATGAQKVLNINTGPRLGLSATPERAGDPVGTAAIFDYFGGIAPPPFTLGDAIAVGTLTPYAYHVHRVALNDDERERWDKISGEIRRLYARLQGDLASAELADRMKRQLIGRAKIVKSAEEKVAMARHVLSTFYKLGSRWIVYCDDQDQLGEVLAVARELVGAMAYEYHSAMSGDRDQTLALFNRSGGIVVSIKCLDEGVDIPAVDSALILASSKNPREYVQRRGRVLRRSEGKSVAHVHDVLVTPRFDPDEPPGTAIVEGELVRAIEFGRAALNPSAIAELEKLAIEYGLDFELLAASGFEDDESQE